MRVKRAFATTVSLQAVQSVISITTGVLIARALGPIGQGIYAVVIASVSLAAALAVLGQFQGIAAIAAEGRDRPSTLLSASFLHSGSVLLIAAVTLPLWSERLGSGSGWSVATAVCVLVSLEVLALMVRGIALGRYQILAYNGSLLAQRILFFAFLVPTARSGTLALRQVLWGWAVSLLISTCIAAGWLWRQGEGRAALKSGVLRAWARTLGRGGRAFVVLAFTLVLIRADVWTLGTLLDVAAVGQMSVALGLAEWLWYVPTMIGNLLFAVVATDRRTQAVERVARASRLIAALSAFGAIVLILGGRGLIIALFGEEFAPAASVFALLIPGMAAIAVHLVVDSYFAGTGFPPITLWAAAGALMTKLLLNLALVPRMGLAGAAVATSIVYVGLLLTKLVWFERLTSTPMRNLLLLNRSDVTYGLDLARMGLKRIRGEPLDPRNAPDRSVALDLSASAKRSEEPA